MNESQFDSLSKSDVLKIIKHQINEIDRLSEQLTQLKANPELDISYVPEAYPVFQEEPPLGSEISQPMPGTVSQPVSDAALPTPDMSLPVSEVAAQAVPEMPVPARKPLKVKIRSQRGQRSAPSADRGVDEPHLSSQIDPFYDSPYATPAVIPLPSSMSAPPVEQTREEPPRHTTPDPAGHPLHARMGQAPPPPQPIIPSPPVAPPPPQPIIPPSPVAPYIPVHPVAPPIPGWDLPQPTAHPSATAPPQSGEEKTVEIQITEEQIAELLSGISEKPKKPSKEQIFGLNKTSNKEILDMLQDDGDLSELMEKKASKKGKSFLIFLSVFAFVTASLFMLTFFWFPIYQIPTDYISQSFSKGDVVIFSTEADIKSGDVIAFKHNNGVLFETVLEISGDRAVIKDFGLLDTDEIIGKSVFRLWPLNKFGTL